MLLLFFICFYFIDVSIGGLDCGRIRGDIKIIGGQPVEKYKYPWIATLSRQGSQQPICAGSLISQRHVLTAAHCFDSELTETSRIPAEKLYNVTLGAYNWCKRERKSKEFQVSKVIVHEKYKKTDDLYVNDIAILELEKKAKFTVVCLPEISTRLFSQKGVIVGWGDSKEGSATGECEQREANVEKYSIFNCFLSKLSWREVWQSSVFCGGGNDVDTCQGDSGGPFLTYTWSKRHVLTGITSYGYGCASKGYPGLYVDVSIFLPWIAEKTNGRIARVSGARVLVLER